jgi:UDP-N-acetylmuramoylalanine-D-glutamate ligase
MILEGRKTLVLGAGKSGISAARFLAKHGATVALHG